MTGGGYVPLHGAETSAQPGPLRFGEQGMMTSHPRRRGCVYALAGAWFALVGILSFGVGAWMDSEWGFPCPDGQMPYSKAYEIAQGFGWQMPEPEVHVVNNIRIHAQNLDTSARMTAYCWDTREREGSAVLIPAQAEFCEVQEDGGLLCGAWRIQCRMTDRRSSPQ